jgi:two-component system, NarL family, sensor histidine kinase UhpB
MSLRFRINLLITTLMLLFMVLVGSIILEDTRKSVREEIEASSKVTVQLLGNFLFSSQLTDAPSQTLERFLRALGRVRANEIRLYNAVGDQLYVSPPTLYKAGRAAPEWYARLVAPQLQEVRISFRSGTLVVTPDPSRSILDAWDDFINLLWIALGFFILVNGLVFWVLGRSLAPMKQILTGLSEMERGRFDTRLPAFVLPELSAIGQTFNRMAGALAESMSENQRLAMIASQSSDAIMILDQAGNITFWNPAAARLFGYDAQEMEGRPATLLAPSGRQDEIGRALAVTGSRKAVENLITQRLAKDGRLIDVALSAAPLIDPHNDVVIGQICSVRDITSTKRAQQIEQELAQNRQLTQLIQSHREEERKALARELHDELGQSVTAIRTIAVSIANRARGSAPEIHANAMTIAGVAGNLYDAMHGIVRQLRPSALDNLGLAETLQDAIASWRELHPEIEFTLQLADDLESMGETVNITVYRIVQECLTNVVRHAAASCAHVAVQRIGDAAEQRLEISVRDNGTGIGDGDLPKNTHFGLLGIRERAHALAGNLVVNSRPGGTTITVTLPLRLPTEEIDCR